MAEALDFVVRHGYLALFLFGLAEQAGLPLPALPILLAGGRRPAEYRRRLPASPLLHSAVLRTSADRRLERSFVCGAGDT